MEIVVPPRTDSTNLKRDLLDASLSMTLVRTPPPRFTCLRSSRIELVELIRTSPSVIVIVGLEDATRGDITTTTVPSSSRTVTSGPASPLAKEPSRAYNFLPSTSFRSYSSLASNILLNVRLPILHPHGARPGTSSVTPMMKPVASKAMKSPYLALISSWRSLLRLTTLGLKPRDILPCVIIPV